MATYIQGLTDYIPQIQPFQPDYNFLSNVLQTKQSRYDAAHKQLSSLYGTMLNSPMLRDQNIQARDEFFKSIDQDIQRMSGLDLSLQQNVDAAQQVFKGLYEDKNIVKDMVWTKNYMNELSRADAFKDCVDPDKCGGSWWEGGVKALNYKAQEFKNASDKDALNFSNVAYVPGQNLTDKAIKAAKDAGFSVKYDEVQGDWIVHTKNGTKMIQPLAEFYVAKFGNDPKMTEFYKTQAYVQRKDWVTQNLGNYNNDEMEANMAYINNTFATLKGDINKAKQDSDQIADVKQAKANQIDQHIKENGYVPSLNWLSDWQDTKDEAVVTKANQAVYKNASDQMTAMGYNKDNIKFALDAIDNLTGLGMLKQASLVAASAYSQLTTEQTFEANPFAIQAKQQAFEMQKMKMTEGYVDDQGVFHPGTDYYNAVEVKKVEWAREEAIRKQVAKDLGLELQADPDKGGTTTDVLNKEQSYSDNIAEVNRVDSTITSNQKAVVDLVLSQAQLANKTGKEDALVLEGVILDMIGPNGKSGINAKKLLAGDAAERAKFDAYVSNPANTANIYKVANDHANPMTANGALNQRWIKDIKTKVDVFNKDITEDQQYKTALRDWSSKQGEIATTDYTSKLNAEGKTLEADAFKDMYANLNSSGFYRANTGQREENRITEAAKKWAEKNQDKFEAEYTINSPAGGGTFKVPRTAMFDKSGKRLTGKAYDDYVASYVQQQQQRFGPYGDAGVSSTKTAYQKAIEYATNVWKEGEADWRKSYAKNASSWQNPEGGKAAGKRTMAFTGNVDAIDRTSQSGKDFADMMNNYNLLRKEAIVNYGDISMAKPKQSNETATAILDAFYTDFVSGAKIDKSGIIPESANDRARANFTVSRIAGHDANTVGFRIIPTAQWAEKYTSTEKKTRLIPEGDTKYQEGIVVYLPKNKVKGDFMTRTEYNKYDFMMDTQDQVKYTNPNAGEIVLQRVGNMYQLTTTATTFDAQGNKIVDGNVSMHNMDINLPQFMETMQNALSYQEMANLQAINNAALMNKSNPAQATK